MDYSKLSEITVKTQGELDNVPKDFTGTVHIEFGTPFNTAIVRDKYAYSVEAYGNSSVVARGNSSVVARENSSVVACGNTQVVDCLMGAKGRIKILGNARIVHNPKNVHEYMDFYGLPHTKKYGTFYKAVHKADGKYISDYDCNFEYEVGKTAKSEYLDTDVSKLCGKGIHVAYLQRALDFGKNWDDLAILEVKAKLDNVIVPLNAGKVRVDEVKVIREVLLEECGLYGKMLANRR